MQLLIQNIKSLIQVSDHSPKIKSGDKQGELSTLDNAWLLIKDDIIIDFGSMDQPYDTKGKTIPSLNADGKFVFPSWCDSHTHLVFAGSRESEFVDKINGLGYEEIAANGGGILNSAKRLQDATEDELLQQANERLDEIMRMGTGAVEIKSGYGLTVDAELKILRVIKKLRETSPLAIKSTFLGAHTFPIAYKNNHQGYIDEIINKMLPVIAEEKLADYIDVFCEKVAFSPEETDQIITAGKKYGLKAKIHTNQFNSMGGIEVSTKHNAISVDHLEVLNDEEIEILKHSTTIATLLPSAPFFLRDNYPPAKKIIAAGVPVALATDYNPGSTPSGKMPFVLSLACIHMRMTPEEAINAATINGAYAMEVNQELGSITKGKKANLFITKPMPSYAYMPYAFGSNLIETVILNGKIQ